MNHRLQGVCLVFAIAASVLMACGGDDSGSDDNSQATAGETARSLPPVPARTGSAGSGTSIWGNPQMCPMTEAEATGSCTPARGSCPFGDRVCDCASDTMSWVCWAASDCPTSVPAERSSCGVVGMSCAPARGETCRCRADGWDCGNQFCPAEEPAVGGACEDGDGECTFGARTCECENDAWVCWDPAIDCPAAPPLDNAACSTVGVSCAYDGGRCACNESGWRCGRRVMNDPPEEDAGVAEGTAGAQAEVPTMSVAGAGAAGAAGTGGAGEGSAGEPAAGTGAGAGGEAAAGSAGAP